MTIRMAAVIVIYNKDIAESIACQRIKTAYKDNLDVLIVDNSTEPNDNGTACERGNFTYVSMHGNKGLSKAYNAAIDICQNKYDLLIFMDDDTELTAEYFQVLEESCRKYQDVDIFAPIVYGQDGVIYSPNEFHFLRSYFIKNEDEDISQERFNAISSMLAVRMRVFDGYRYNENLFVDQVDQNIFCEQRKRNKKFMKMDCVIHQNFFQRGETLEPEIGWNRLRLRIVDIMRHAELIGGRKYRLLGFIKCCGLGLQIGKKSKSAAIPFKAFFLAASRLFRK